MIELILFILSTIGITHIIIDGSIMTSFREGTKRLAEKIGRPHLGDIVDCYMCCGTWCGFLMGFIWISSDPLKIIACGFAGGFISNLAAVILNYFEAKTIVSLDDHQTKEKDER